MENTEKYTEIRTLSTHWTCSKCKRKFVPQMAKVHFEKIIIGNYESWKVVGFSCLNGCR